LGYAKLNFFVGIELKKIIMIFSILFFNAQQS
jgi:hypothetical protein